MITYQTQPWRSYCITAVTVPCVVTADVSGRTVKIITIDEQGQAVVCAPDTSIKIDQDDAIITPVFKGASLGLSAKGGVRKFYITIDEQRRFDLFNTDLVTDGVSLLEHLRKFSRDSFTFANCLDARLMFQYSGMASEKLIVNFPKALNIEMMFQDAKFSDIEVFAPESKTCWGICNRCYPVTRLKLHAPKNQNIGYILCNCMSIESIELDAKEVIYASNAFHSCRALKNACVLLTKCITAPGAFFNCALDAENINAILESLPIWTDSQSHVITFTGCPGAATCSHEIGTAKGWTVEI